MTSRRRFLSLVAAGTAGWASVPSEAGARLVELSTGGSLDESFWRLVKAEFPVRPGLVMMNAANLCPSPFAVRDAVTQYTRDIDSDASFQNRAKFRALREEARGAIAAMVGADDNEIALTRNTSEGNNTVVHGLALETGDEVVVWDENHPTNLRSWEVRGAREGFTVRKVAVDQASDPVQPFLAAMNANTRVLAFSHLSNVTGRLLPAQRLCQEASRRGIRTLVDGAQTFGSLELDLHGMGCDFFSSSSHKWFLGPKEAGILYVRQEMQDELTASDVGIGWDSAVENGAQKFESLGQRDDACVTAMGTAAAFQNRIGPKVVEARVRELAEALMNGLSASIPGVQFATPPQAEARAGVVIFSLPGTDTREAFNRLYHEFNVAGAPQRDGIRLSPHIYNTLDDVEIAVKAATRIAAD
ncbi:MAG: isopenicillin-N epimerase [Rhodothermales bacterium]|jgi:isopenicillin-N epimerase